MKYPFKKIKFNATTLIVSMLATSTLLLGCPQKTVLDTDTTANFCDISNQPFAHSVCSIETKTLLEDNSQYKLALFWKPDNNNTDKGTKPLYTFDALIAQLNSQNQTLNFAANAGMYNADFAPIGYTVIDSKQILSLNLKDGGGNFHLLPNGVFWWDDSGFYVTESKEMNKILANGAKPKYATQSGPMLVIEDEIHPKFKQESTSKKIRNGVGICQIDGKDKLTFVTSATIVNFYDFAALFKDTLNCNNALFLDGGIASALYAPNINRHDKKNMGVMVGLVKDNAISANK